VRVQKRYTDFNLAAWLARLAPVVTAKNRGTDVIIIAESKNDPLRVRVHRHHDANTADTYVYTDTPGRPGVPFDVTHGTALRRETHFLKPVLGCPRIVGGRAGLHISIWQSTGATSPRLALSSPHPFPRCRLTYDSVAYFIPDRKNGSQRHEAASCQRLINGRRRRLPGRHKATCHVLFPIRPDPRLADFHRSMDRSARSRAPPWRQRRFLQRSPWRSRD